MVVVGGEEAKRGGNKNGPFALLRGLWNVAGAAHGNHAIATACDERRSTGAEQHDSRDKMTGRVNAVPSSHLHENVMILTIQSKTSQNYLSANFAFSLVAAM